MKKYFEFIIENINELDPYGEEDWDDENLNEYQLIARNYRLRYPDYGNFDERFLELFPNSISLKDFIINAYRNLYDYVRDKVSSKKIDIDNLEDHELVQYIISDNSFISDELCVSILGYIDPEFQHIIEEMIYELMGTRWNNVGEFYNNALLLPMYMPIEVLGFGPHGDMNENIHSDIDPYGEEDWESNDLYVIYVIGQDMHFLAKKVRRNVGRYHEFVYEIACKRENRQVTFSAGYNTRDPYPVSNRNKNRILNGEEMVGYVTDFGSVRRQTLESLCHLIGVKKEDINFYTN